MEDLAGHTLIGIEPGIFGGPVADWIENKVPQSLVRLRRNSIEGIYFSLKRGLGVSLMSEIVAMAEPDLVYCFTPDIEQDHGVWLLTHESLRTEPRIRAVLDFLAPRLTRLLPKL